MHQGCGCCCCCCCSLPMHLLVKPIQRHRHDPKGPPLVQVSSYLRQFRCFILRCEAEAVQLHLDVPLKRAPPTAPKANDKYMYLPFLSDQDSMDLSNIYNSSSNIKMFTCDTQNSLGFKLGSQSPSEYLHITSGQENKTPDGASVQHHPTMCAVSLSHYYKMVGLENSQKKNTTTY